MVNNCFFYRKCYGGMKNVCQHSTRIECGRIIRFGHCTHGENWRKCMWAIGHHEYPIITIVKIDTQGDDVNHDS